MYLEYSKNFAVLYIGEQSVSKISPEMQKGWLDNIKESLTGVINQYKGDDESKDE